jgi:outer membrane protein TolC
LSLRDAVARSLDYNARLLDSRDGVEQAALSLELARSEFRPQITPNMFGSFGGNDLSNQQYSLDFSQRFTTGTALRATVGSASSQNQFGNFYTGDTTVQISQSLLRGFGRALTRRGLTTAETQLQTTRRQRVLAERQVAIDVASAYYAIVAQEELVAVAEQAVARSRELLAASEARLEVGRVSRLDVFRAQQLASQSEARLLDAKTAVEDAQDRLRDLLGYDWEYQFRVEPGIPIPSASPITTDEAIAQARVNRLELQTALATVDDAERAVGAARNQLLPQVDVNASFTRRETADSLADSFGVDNFQFASFLSVSMPVDRTPQQTALRTAAMALSRQRRELARLERSLVREARQAVRQQSRLRQSLGIADAQISFAEQEVELAAFRYQRGLSNNLDVVNAEANLLAGRAGRVGLLAQLAVAQLQLRATLGTLDPRRDVL